MITITVTGDEAASRYLGGVIRRVMDLEPAFFEIGGHFRKIIDGQFSGGGWAPLKPYTIAWKGHAAKLIHSGGMRQSWVTRGAPGNISEEGAQRAAFGSEHELVHWHQWGTRRMVARPVDTSPTGRFNQQIVDEISEWIING